MAFFDWTKRERHLSKQLANERTAKRTAFVSRLCDMSRDQLDKKPQRGLEVGVGYYRLKVTGMARVFCGFKIFHWAGGCFWGAATFDNVHTFGDIFEKRNFLLRFRKKYASKRSVFESFLPDHTKAQLKQWKLMKFYRAMRVYTMWCQEPTMMYDNIVMVFENLRFRSFTRKG